MFSFLKKVLLIADLSQRKSGKRNPMSLEACSILTYVLLILTTVLIQGMHAGMTLGIEFGISNREQKNLDKGPLGIRIDNTLGNLKEGAIMYLPLTLLTLHLGISNSWTYYAALATIISRICYVPIYIFGIQKVRTIVWIPSILAIPSMVYGICMGMPQ